MIEYDGFEDALIGTGVRCGQQDVNVYSFEKMVDVLVKRDEMDYDMAAEFIDYNYVGAYLGETTPIIVVEKEEE